MRHFAVSGLRVFGVTAWFVVGSLLFTLLFAAASPVDRLTVGQMDGVLVVVTTLGIALLSGLIVDALRCIARRWDAGHARRLPSLASVIRNELGWHIPGRW